MAKMSDFELLKALQKELVETLEERKRIGVYVPRSCSKAKIRRLRLQIQEVTVRIENKCRGWKNGREGWE